MLSVSAVVAGILGYVCGGAGGVWVKMFNVMVACLGGCC